jgi:hypothetical protein
MERHIEVLESYIDMKELVTWRDARVAEMDEQSTHTVILEPSTSKLRHLYSYSHGYLHYIAPTRPIATTGAGIPRRSALEDIKGRTREDELGGKQTTKYPEPKSLGRQLFSNPFWDKRRSKRN